MMVTIDKRPPKPSLSAIKATVKIPQITRDGFMDIQLNAPMNLGNLTD